MKEYPHERVSIKRGRGSLYVTSPYHPDLIREARRMGGRFIRGRKEWVFPESMLESVTQTLRSVYGTAGEPVEYEDVVLSRIEPTHNDLGTCYRLGRLIASRLERDSRVQLGYGVELIDGGFRSRAGSQRSPKIGENDAVVRVHNAPKRLVEKEIGSEEVEVVG